MRFIHHKGDAINMKIEMMPIGELIPYEKNPRKNDLAIPEVAKSLKEFGWQQPIVIDREKVVVVGHTRLLAAKAIGMPQVPIKYADELSPAQIKAYRIMDNRTHEFAKWNPDMLLEELATIEEENPELSAELLGFDDQAVELLEQQAENEKIQHIEPQCDEDETPEPPKEPRSKLGDLYQLGNHRLLCGDSTSIDAVEKLMGGEKADCVWTDPPYNVALGMETPEQAKARNRRTDGLTVMNDKMEDSDFRQFLTDVFSAASVVTKPGGGLYVAHADSEGYNFRGAARDSGWLVKQCLIWKKSSLVMGRQDYQWIHEPILYGWKNGGSHCWYGDRKQTTVLEFPKPSRNGEHPTMKPVELVQYCLNNSVKSGNVVLDCFGGSGTTLIASEKLNLRAHLMELDPKYVDVIVSRYCKYSGATKVIRNGQEIEWVSP